MPLNGRAQSTRRGAAFAASILVLAVTPFAATATAGPQRDADVRFSTFNASLNRNNSGRARPRPVDAGNAAGAATSPRSSSGPGPTCCSSTSSTSTRSARRPVPGQLPVGAAQRRPADQLPIPLHRAVEHRHSVRLRPRQQRRRSAGRTTPLASASSPASSGWPSTRSIRSTRAPSGRSSMFLWKDMPGALLPDDPNTARTRRLVFAGRAGRLQALIEEPLGPADPDRQENRALPRQPPDAAGFRRPGGSQRNAQPRRDPLLGRLHHARHERLHLRRRGTARRAEARRALRDRRRPELRPARRRQHPGLGPAAARPPAREHEAHAVEPGRGRGSRAPGRREPHAQERSALRHGRLRRRAGARATCAPTTCCRARTCRSSTARVFWPLSTDPLFRLVGTFPFPSSDHRLVWIDVSVPGV